MEAVDEGDEMVDLYEEFVERISEGLLGEEEAVDEGTEVEPVGGCEGLRVVGLGFGVLFGISFVDVITGWVGYAQVGGCSFR